MRIARCIRGSSRILSVLKEHLPHDDVFECNQSDVAERVQDCDVIIPIVTPLPVEILRTSRLKLVQQYGVGLDIVDVPTATRYGVLVANVPSVGSGNAESVAELAIAHMLMLSRQIPLSFQRFRERRFSSPIGDCLWRSTVVILGYGGIGEEIARRLVGFGVRVIAVSRHGPNGARKREPSVRPDLHVGLEELYTVLKEADYLVVAVPASPENLGLVNEEVLAQLRPGTYVVNIARGPVIDYQALLSALRDGRIAGAGLDVFWTERFDPDDALLELNVIATPHIGGATALSLRGIGEMVAKNVDAVRQGNMPDNCANPEAWPTWWANKKIH